MQDYVICRKKGMSWGNKLIVMYRRVDGILISTEYENVEFEFGAWIGDWLTAATQNRSQRSLNLVVSEQSDH